MTNDPGYGYCHSVEDLRHNKETSNDLVTAHLLAQTSQQSQVCLGFIKICKNEKEQNNVSEDRILLYRAYAWQTVYWRQFQGVWRGREEAGALTDCGNYQ